MSTAERDQAKARQYRERASQIRASAAVEPRPYKRSQQLAYADHLERIAKRYEAVHASDMPPMTMPEALQAAKR